MPTTPPQSRRTARASNHALWCAVLLAGLAVFGALFLLFVRGDALIIDLASAWSAIVACF